MRLVLGAREFCADWVARHIGAENGYIPPFEAMGFTTEAGVMVGGAVFNQMTRHDVHVHLAGRGALMRGSLRAIWHYLAVQQGLLRATALVSAANVRMTAILPRAGFVEEGRLRRFYGQHDAIVFGLLAEDVPEWMRTADG